MALLLAAAQIAVIACIPGAALFRLPWGDRARRAALSPEERAFWYVVLSLTVSLGAALALAAAGKYTLNRVLLVDIAVAAAAAMGARGRLRLGSTRHVSWGAAAPLAIVILGCWLYFPTAEYVMGGKDPGVYISEGIQIVQRGTLSIDDRLVASVPEPFRELFFAPMPGRPYYGIRFMGFFLFDPATGHVVGQFPHLFPVSVAIAYGIADLDGARSVVALWTILGLVAVYFVAARLVGRAVALIATLLVAINVIEVWYGRYPNSEVVFQAMLMAALLAADRALVDRDRFFEPVAGILLALPLFLRIDAVLGIGAVLAALVLASLRGERLGWRFFAAMALVSGLAIWYLLDLLAGYSAYPVGFLRDIGPGRRALLVGSIIAAWLVFVTGTRMARRFSRAIDVIPAVLAGALLVLSAYAYFFRHPEGTLAPHDAYALRTYAWYVTAPGLLAAVIGTAWLIHRRFWTSPAFFSAVITFSFFVFYKVRIVPEHFWMTRRFLPLILPACGIAIAALAAACADARGPLAQWLSRRRAQKVQPVLAGLAVVLVGALATAFWRASAPVRPHVEYAGMIGHLARILEKSAPDDLVLVEARGVSDMHVLALPLAYIYGRNVLVLASGQIDHERLGQFADWARRRFPNVYFLGRGRPLLSTYFGVEQVWSDVFWVPEFESVRNAYPSAVRLKEFRYEQCRLVGAEVAADAAVPLDDLHVVDFYEIERDPRGSWRWSRGQSDVLLTNVTPDTRSVLITMEAGGRPPSAPPAVVDVTLGGRLLGRVTVGRGMQPYAFAVPHDLASVLASSEAPAVLRLAVPAWVPRQLLGTPDDRALGVMVSHIEVSSAPWPRQP